LQFPSLPVLHPEVAQVGPHCKWKNTHKKVQWQQPSVARIVLSVLFFAKEHLVLFLIKNSAHSRVIPFPAQIENTHNKNSLAMTKPATNQQQNHL
jgi:hypothetical protein